MDMERLKEVIPIGKANAIHQEELARRLGVNPAGAKRIVRKARAAGMQIMSSQCGYWITDNDADMQAYFDMMRRQALSRLKTIKPVRNTLNETKGQISLSDVLAGAGKDER